MYYTLTTKILGDRTAFGYSYSGANDGTGRCSVRDAVEVLDEHFRDHEWKYPTWNGDILTVDFERKELANQIINTVELQPETYAEFLVLKKWEKDNGFV